MMSFFKKEDKDRKKRLHNTSSDQINPDIGDDNSEHQMLSSSSKSSIDSTQNQPQIILPPKPKKGILKTISKFGLTPHIQSNLHSSNNTPKLAHKVQNPAPIQPQAQSPVQIKSIEQSIPTFSKRNSQFLNEQVSSDLSSFILPKLTQIPVYLTLDSKQQQESTLETFLTRSITLPSTYLSRIELSEVNSIEAAYKPILIDLKENEFLFYPNDQLLAVNDETVLNKNLAQVKNYISSLDGLDFVKFKVRTSLDFVDLVLKDYLKENKPSVSSSPNSEDSETNQVWLTYPNGYQLVKIFAKVIHKNSGSSLENFSPTSAQVVRFKIRLENGSLIEVNEDSLEKSNPSQFDYLDDLTKLRFINETSLIHCLRQRYLGLRLNHTLIGNQNLIVLSKPNQLWTNCSPSTDRMISIYKNLFDSQPKAHVYSYTQSVYKNMLSNRQDQTILLMGHSASGKTNNSKLVLNYLLNTASNSSNSSNFNETKLNAMFCLLNAFCTVKTENNILNANRFLNIFLLDFNHSGQLLSLLLQLIQFDQTRLIYQPNNESNYLIFYNLIFGSNSNLKNDLYLNSDLFSLDETNTGNLFFTSVKHLNEQEASHSIKFDQILNSFKTLHFEEHEVKSILSILATILHLGKSGAIKSNQSRGQFQNVNSAQKAAQLLGLSLNQLTDYVFSYCNPNNSTPNRTKYSHLSNNGSARVSPDTNPSALNNTTPTECLQGFCLGLYQECLNLVINCINRYFKQTYQIQATSNSILVIDPPGFQSNSSHMASYSDLICNYICERLQLMFYQINFINPIEKCAQEGLDIDLVEHIPESPSSLVNWLDKQVHSNPIFNRSALGLNSPQLSSSSQDSNLGLLWLLEEQMLNENKKPRDFIQRLIESDTKQNFITTNSDSSNFTIYHQFGQFPVDYNLETWLESFNKEFLIQRNVLSCLQDSKKEAISSTFYQSGAMNAMLNSLNGPLDQAGSSSLKRQASVRKMLTLSKRKTFMINFKLQIDSLFDSMRKTKCNFVFCLLPSYNYESNDLEISLIRNQLKAYQLLATCRIYRQGYPEYLNFEEFIRRFSMFLSNDKEYLNNMIDHKQSCLNLIKSFDLDSSLYKIGNTQIFFKAGILAKLEDQRDEKLNYLIVKLQANCRQYLAKKNFQKKKIQDSAVRCVQKNIRIWFALKKWKWWRLYTNLMPILNVQNHEHVLEQLKKELDEYKKKYEKFQLEKNELKVLNNQLENKLMNLQTDYVEEHAANAGTIDLLEVETSERMRLEKELNELRPLYNETIKKLELIETEMLELRLYNTKKSIEQELEKDDIDGLSVPNSPNQKLVAQSQFDSLKRENELLKKQLKQEKENVQLFNLNERQFFESKLKEKDLELLDLEKQTALHKRKYQKICEEMQDLERLCDENKVRNRELEKIQSKFDSEMASLKFKLDQEKELREKCERERDSAKYEIFSLKSELDTQKLETNYHIEKCERLERDLKEYELTVSAQTSSNSANLNTDQYLKLKSQLRDLEGKLRDQEEELDEQTFTIQQLEQTKLKLEMQLEKEKQKWNREIAEKESEMDDLRFNTQKKIKSIEMQLEEESEISSQLQREKRDLERKIRELQSNNGLKNLNKSNDLVSGESVNDYIIKLKRHMLKYKTLAIDAQTQLEKLKENIPKQSILKALKAQLEDSEFTKANALKNKQLLQVEIENLQSQLDEANLHKQNLEEQNMHLNRELSNLRSELEEQERDADDILKKYQNHIQNYTLDSHRFLDLSNQIDILTIENRILKEKIREMEEKISVYESSWVDKTQMNKLENKNRELESKLEFEITHKNKIQNQLDRVKLQYENSLNEIELILSREKKLEENLRKTQRYNKEIMEEFGDLKKKLIDLEETRKRLEQQNEILERELESSKSEIKINLTRLEAFQSAFNAMNNESDEEVEEEEEDDTQNDDEDQQSNYDEDLDTDNTFKYLNSSLSRISTKSIDYSK